MLPVAGRFAGRVEMKRGDLVRIRASGIVGTIDYIGHHKGVRWIASGQVHYALFRDDEIALVTV